MAEAAGGVALVCPGQGAQRMGGVRALPVAARAVFERASGLIGLDLWEAGLRGPAERLALPSVLQPFLVAWATADYARTRAERPDLPAPDYVMGHSSGENAALVLSGAVSFEAGVGFAYERGLLLEAGCRAERTGLIALAGAGRAEAEAIAAEAGLQRANHNAWDQYVLAGATAGLERARAVAASRGVKARILGVAGGFHTAYFREADEAAEPLIAALAIGEGFTPLIGNARGQVIGDAAGVRAELAGQYSRPVEWVAALEAAYAAGVRTFVVLGPGNAMHGLVRRFSATVAEPLRSLRLRASTAG